MTDDDDHIRKRGPRKAEEYLRAKGAYRKDPQRDPRRRKAAGKSEWLMWRLLDSVPPDAHPDDLAAARYIDEAALRAAWQQHSASILAKWIERRPGTRPSCWWLFDAPRTPTVRKPNFEAAQRQRLGGRGTAEHDALNFKPVFWCGLPVRWIEDATLAYYLRHSEAPQRWLTVQPFARSDPPSFESQAAFLRRHELLTEREASELTAADFEPVPLPTDLWPKENDQ